MPQMKKEEALRVKLEALKTEHRDLDEAIAAVANQPGGGDSLALRRLKKRKLACNANTNQKHISWKLGPIIPPSSRMKIKVG